MKIFVTIKSVYGNDTIYPVCRNAHTFADLARTTSLTVSAIKLIKGLGVEVVELSRSQAANWDHNGTNVVQVNLG